MTNFISHQIVSLANSSLDLYPDNTLTKYTHRLPSPIIVPPNLSASIAVSCLVIHTQFKEPSKIGYIKIHLSQLAPQIAPSQSDAQVLARIPFEKESISPVWHRIEEPIFYPLTNISTIYELSFLITDENNKQLPLSDGPTSIIYLELRMSQYSASFSMTLSSSVSKELYSDNSLSSWRTELPESISLDPSWEVALYGVHVPSAVILKNKELEFTLNRRNKTDPKILKLELEDEKLNDAVVVSGYLSEFLLSSGFLLSLSRTGEIKIKQKPNPNYGSAYSFASTLAQMQQILEEKNDKFISLTLSPFTVYVLGLNPGANDDQNLTINLPTNNETMTLRNAVPNYNNKTLIKPIKIDHIAVYCNIVEPSIIGNSSAHILDVVPTDSLGLLTSEKDTFYVIKHLMYRGISSLLSKTIEVSLKTLDGQSPPLSYSSSVKKNNQIPLSLTLVFRRI
jgi:hypothetical protein